MKCLLMLQFPLALEDEMVKLFSILSFMSPLKKRDKLFHIKLNQWSIPVEIE